MTHVATWYLRCECQRVPNHPRTPIVNRVDARVTVLALQPSRCLLKDTVYTPQPELWQLKVVSRLFLHFSIAAHSAQPTQVPSNSTVVSRTNGIVMKDITSTNYSSLSPPSLSLFSFFFLKTSRKQVFTIAGAVTMATLFTRHRPKIHRYTTQILGQRTWEKAPPVLFSFPRHYKVIPCT